MGSEGGHREGGGTAYHREKEGEFSDVMIKTIVEAEKSTRLAECTPGMHKALGPIASTV